MDEPTIVLPRRWVEALVDPKTSRFVYDGCCRYCGGDWRQTGPALGHGFWQHTNSCPVRLVQERLQERHKDT